MKTKSPTQETNFITFKAPEQYIDMLDHLRKGCGNSSRSDIIRRSIKYAFEHPYEVFSYQQAKETK